jgi:hypothetical protein
MKLESNPSLQQDLGRAAAALSPLLWIVAAALLAVVTLMFAPVPPL